MFFEVVFLHKPNCDYHVNNVSGNDMRKAQMLLTRLLIGSHTIGKANSFLQRIGNSDTFLCFKFHLDFRSYEIQ